MIARARTLWAYRELVTGMVARELRARYRGSVLGFVWSLLNPLLMLGVYALVFAHAMRGDQPHYEVFVLAGLLPWTWFSSGTAAAAGAIVANSHLVRKVAFPREILVVVAVAAALGHYVLAWPVLAVFALASGIAPATVLSGLPALLPLVAIQFLLMLGLGLLLATANTFFRDVEQLLGVGLLAMFYLSPVLYPLTFLPPGVRAIVAYNPAVALIAGYQQALLAGTWPDPSALAYPLAVALALLAVGTLAFARHAHGFAEVV